MNSTQTIQFALVVVTVVALVGCGRSDIYRGPGESVGDPGGPDAQATFVCEFADIADIHGTDSSNVWVVGEGGCVLYFDGVEWVAEEAPVNRLNAIHVVSDQVAFAVGGDAVWKRSSSGWEQMFSMQDAEFVDVWAGPVEDYVVAVGRDNGTNTGVIAVYDGADWNQPVPQAIPPVMSVYGEHPDSVWVGGEELLLLHFDGAQWLFEETGIEYGSMIGHIHGRGEGELWFHVLNEGPPGCGFIMRRVVDDQGEPAFYSYSCWGDWASCCYLSVWTVDGEDILAPSAGWMGKMEPTFNGFLVISSNGLNAAYDLPQEDRPEWPSALWGVSVYEFYVAGPVDGAPVLWKLDVDSESFWEKIWAD